LSRGENSARKLVAMLAPDRYLLRVLQDLVFAYFGRPCAGRQAPELAVLDGNCNCINAPVPSEPGLKW
jgi:hypothetical protein